MKNQKITLQEARQSKKSLGVKIILIGFLMIFLMGNVSAIYESHGVAMASTDSGCNGYQGMRFHTNQSVYVYNVTKHASDSSTNGSVLWANKTVIGSASMVGNDANFSAPILLNANTDYWIVGGGDTTPQFSGAGSFYPVHGVTGQWEGSTWCGGSNYTNSAFSIIQMGIVLVTTEPPTVTLISPVDEFNNTNNTNYLVANVTAGSGTSIVNVSLYFNGTINQTNTSTFSGVYYNFTIAIPDGDFNWSITAYSNESSKTDSTTRNISVGDFFMINNTYNPFALEQSTQTFYMNFSKRAALSVSSVNLTYNQTNYSATFSIVNSTFINATATINLPSVTADINKTFNWSILMTDSTLRNSSDFQQQIQNLGIDNCAANTIQIFNFTMLNETDQLNMSSTGDNTSMRVDLSLYPNVSKSVATITFSQLYTEINPARICISDALGSSIFYTDVQVQYDADGYVQEFYNIQNYSLNATSNPSQNITLFDLNDSLSQAYTITYRDESFLPVQDALIQIQRKYVDEGVFKVVEIPKTDINGQTVGHLITNDVIYTFTVVKNGRVLATFESQNAICQTPAVDPCEINLNSFLSTIDVTDYQTSLDFSYTLTYNASSRTISSTFSIPSGAVSLVSLNVTQEDALGTSVCASQVTTSAGTLNCVVGSNFGNSTVLAKLYKGGNLVAQGQIKLDQDPSDIYGGIQVVLALFIMLTLIGAAISDSPVYTVIFFMTGVIMLFALNLVANNGFIGATATILWLIVGIVIVIIKGANRS